MGNVQNLQKLVKSAKTARKGHKSVTLLIHLEFSVVHAFNNDLFSIVCRSLSLARHESVRNDAEDLPAS